jgi:hypothetical protein
MKTPDLDGICFVTRHFNNLQGLRSKVPIGLVALSAAAALFPALPPVSFLSGLLLALALGFTAAARTFYRKRFGEVETQATESLSIYTPAGVPASFNDLRPLSPYKQRLLATMMPAFAVFVILQATSPVIIAEDDGSYWVTLDSVDEAQPAWTRGIRSIISGGEWMQLSVLFSQFVLLLFGACFLGVWLWRERRSSQRLYLVLGTLLLGLSAFGCFLGYFVYAEQEWLVRVINITLPFLVRPWAALLLCGAAMILAGLFDHWQLVRMLGTAAHEEEPA